MIDFHQKLINVISNPSTRIPEELINYIFEERKRIRSLTMIDLLKLFSNRVMVEFAVGEAKLVLHIFEAEYPDDCRPRDAILAAEEWLRSETETSAAAAAYAAAAGAAAYAAGGAAAYAARSAAAAAAGAARCAVADAAWSAADAAGAARCAVDCISLEDQFGRLFELSFEKKT